MDTAVSANIELKLEVHVQAISANIGFKIKGVYTQGLVISSDIGLKSDIYSSKHLLKGIQNSALYKYKVIL